MILVTGAAGFIGQHLVYELVRENYEVGVLINKTPTPARWLNVRPIKIFTVDISKRADFSSIPENIDFEAVFHLAAYIPRRDDFRLFRKCFQVNCTGTNNLLQFCLERGVKKVINSSTVSVYGENNPKFCKPGEDTPLHPSTYYGISKLMGELLCERFSKISNSTAISLRYSSVYGAGQNPTTVVPIFVNRACSNKGLVIFGEGARVQDFVYVNDVVGANLNALRLHAEGVFNIGSGTGANMLTLAETTIRVFESKSKITLDKGKEENASGVIMDISKAQKVLGYKVNCDLESGLADYRRVLVKKEQSAKGTSYRGRF